MVVHVAVEVDDVVLERDASSAARRQGYGVTLSETNAALEGLGILDACRARDARESRSKAHWTFHATGRVLGYYGAAFLPEPARVPSEGAAPPSDDDAHPGRRARPRAPTNLRVPRNDVREMLLAKLPPDVVRFGARAVGYEEDDRGVDVHVELTPLASERDDALGSEPPEEGVPRTRVGGGAGRGDEESAESESNRRDASSDAPSSDEGRSIRGLSAASPSPSPSPSPRLETIRASVLIAADGVRSAVQRLRRPNDRLRYLGVVLVTGFTVADHPLLRDRGFYTVDGGTARVFTMPFSGHGAGGREDAAAPREEKGRPAGKETASEEAASESAFSASENLSSSREKKGKKDTRVENEKEKPLVNMWQISVRCSEAEALAVASAPRRGPGGAEAFVRAIAGKWHDPLPAMFDQTDWEDAWAGPLYDRAEPSRDTVGGPSRSARSRVVAIGDAAHPMSPFKGQGANTALFDAWALADWLARAPATTALACFEREMAARAWPKVRASREACEAFHSSAVLDPTFAGVAGVEEGRVAEVLEAFERRGVAARLGEALEARAKEAIEEVMMRGEGRAARETRGLEWTGGGTTRGCTHFSRASASSTWTRPTGWISCSRQASSRKRLSSCPLASSRIAAPCIFSIILRGTLPGRKPLTCTCWAAEA